MNDNLWNVSSRRHFLATQTLGIGSVALAWLLNQDGLLAAPTQPPLERPVFDLKPKPPHVAPQARAMISIFMQGGPSHLDLFDPKPELDQHDGQQYSGDIVRGNALIRSEPDKRKLMASPWKFKKHGRCGMDLSELLPHLAEVVDDITLIRSMNTPVNNHDSSVQALNTGRTMLGRPVLGSWLTYALGSETQNLPAYVVLTDPASLPIGGVRNWSNGWLPSLYQGTVVRAREPRILNLDAPPQLRGAPQESLLAYLDGLNREHLNEHPGESDLAARIASYELAARMQVAAKEALDLSDESEQTRKLYGLGHPDTRDFGTRCLIARRLVERGVRFVQILGASQQWDHHNQINKRLPDMCRKTDKPSAALVQDLKARGLLDTTLVHWGGEMGRTPTVQDEKSVGRDHNTFGFSMWLAGGGVRGGCVHGATDEIGYKAVTDPVAHYDYHATLLYLFGLDHKHVVFKRSNGDATLTDGQQARIVSEILHRPPAI